MPFLMLMQTAQIVLKLDYVTDDLVLALALQVLYQLRLNIFIRKSLITLPDISGLTGTVDESTEFSLCALFLLFSIVLADVGLILERVVQPFKSRMREYAIFRAAQACFLIVVFALFWQVEHVIGGPPVVETFVSIHTVIPVMVLTIVLAKLCLVSK